MLIVSGKAAQYLRETLSRKEESAPGAFRIVNSEEGYELTINEANDGDQVFEHEGEKYLLQAAEVGEGLSNATLDVQESPEGLPPALSEGGAT